MVESGRERDPADGDGPAGTAILTVLHRSDGRAPGDATAR